MNEYWALHNSDEWQEAYQKRGPGIYLIRNKWNGRVYIGQTKNFAQRWGEHLTTLDKGNHASPLLQADWNFMGYQSLQFEIAELYNDLETLWIREKHWIDSLKKQRIQLYNCPSTIHRVRVTTCRGCQSPYFALHGSVRYCNYCRKIT